MARVLKRLGLKRRKINLNEVETELKNKRPVLTLFIDESGQGHYSVIKGIKNDHYVFNDSYWGENYSREKKRFEQQAKTFGQWHWSIAPQV